MAKKESNSTKWAAGTVHWFDPISGEGMIKSQDGSLYFVHHSAIEALANAKSKKQQALKDNQKIKFQLIEDTTFSQVSRVREMDK